MTERWSASFVQTALYASKSISLAIDSFIVISCNFQVILWYSSSLYITAVICASPARCKKFVRKSWNLSVALMFSFRNSRLALASLLASWKIVSKCFSISSAVVYGLMALARRRGSDASLLFHRPCSPRMLFSGPLCHSDLRLPTCSLSWTPNPRTRGPFRQLTPVDSVTSHFSQGERRMLLVMACFPPG